MDTLFDTIVILAEDTPPKYLAKIPMNGVSNVSFYKSNHGIAVKENSSLYFPFM